MCDTPRWKQLNELEESEAQQNLGRCTKPDKDLRRSNTGEWSVGNLGVLEQSELDESASAMAHTR